MVRAAPGRSGLVSIVSNDLVFVTVSEGAELLLWAIDRVSGDLSWSRRLGAGNAPGRKGDLSSPSPLADGERVWAVTGTGLVVAFDLAGRELWRRDLAADYGPLGVLWGYASSPIEYGQSVFVQVLHGFETDDPSYVLALDKRTGETRWRVERPTDALLESPDAYTTPALAEVGGGHELVVLGGDYVTGHDLESGRELWRSGGLNPGREKNYRIVASPLTVGDLVVAPTRVRPMLVLRAGGRGDVTASHHVWATDDGPDVPTPASDGERLLVLNDQGILWLFDLASGRQIWGRQRAAPGTYSASPLIAGDRAWVTNEQGVTSVVQLAPEFAILARNELDEYTLASPAAAAGQLFLRTREHLWCLGAAAAAPVP